LNNMTVDRKTLAWIKQGVEETLKDVSHAPDEFAQNTDDTSPIQRCIAPLHRVKGAVEIIGIQGALLLTMELEQLAYALAENNVKQKKEAAEVLATGLLQLPGYLESLYYGQPDIPLILLPLLNDIRAIQDKELLTEGEFFSPDLLVTPPLQPESKCIVKGDIEIVAKKLRPGYLSGLLGFIKEVQVTESLEKLILVVDNLQIASTTIKAKQLWWIALAVIESLYERTLEPSIAIKILLGRVDRQIQRVIEFSEQMLTEDPPDKIIKNLLYYVAQSTSKNEQVIEVKKAFGLDYPDDSIVEKARENLYGFNTNLIESISGQVKEELTTIKDALDIAMHAKAGSTSGLDAVLERFSAVADALGMLGMSTPKELIDEQKNFLKPKIANDETLDDEDFMRIASTLLQVESSLSSLGSTLDSNHNCGDLPPAEYEKLLKLLAQEIIKEIRIIKDDINTYSLNPSDTESLHNIPQRLHIVTGAMQMLQHKIQVNLSNAINDYITQELIESNDTVSARHLDLLADAIIGLENYYQTILEESVAPEIGLQVASQSLTQLGYPPQEDKLKTPYNNIKPENDISLTNSA